MSQTVRSFRRTRAPLGALALALFVSLALVQPAETQPAKKVFAIEDYARWKSIENNRISGDGNWVAYGFRYPNALDPQPVLHLVRLDGNRADSVANGTQPAFSDDSRWLAYYVELPYAEAKKLRDGNKPVTRKAQLLDLQSGTKQTWEDIQSFAFSPGSGHLLLKRRPPDPKAKHKGADVILHDLKSGYDQLLGSVNEAVFNQKGELLAFTVDAAEKDANGLFVVDLRSSRVHPLDDDTKNYSRLTWNEAGTALAVLKGLEVEKQSEKVNVLLAFADLNGLLGYPVEAGPVLLDTTAVGFPRGHVVSEKRELFWSADGKLVFLGVKQQRAALDTTEKKKGTDELADVDVWNTKDARIQSVQMQRAESDRNFTYRAAFDVTARRFVPLADSTMRELDLTLDGRWGIGRDDRAYISDYKRPSADLYRVNPATGERTLMLRAQITNTSTGSHIFGTSPDGRHFLYWRDGRFQLYDLDAATSRTLAGNGAVNFVNREFDHPGPRPAYGLASWTKDGKAVVLLHRYDLWLVPLDGGAPANLTNGLGARNEIRFRVINTVSTEGMGPLQRARTLALDPSQPILLSAYGQWTKQAGYYELRDGRMNELVYEGALFGSLSKAAKADKFLFTRESFVEFPDLRVAGPSFKDARRLTDANPQQAEYAWGRRVLFDFTNKKGVRLQGILALPDDYQPGQKRPMIVSFYEKNSQNLHRYPAPSLLGSMGSIPIQAVSQGYITMLPDVHFNTGTSHSDMLECVEAATRKVLELGYADPKRIGVHGHSYGGQGVAFIGTRSRLFAAVGMGAGVTDLTSDFNHNWGWSYQVPGRDGSNGYDYYLYSQGRQGTTPWDNPELYRFESAMTHVREVTAPFLIMHGTADPTVSFQEGLGFYNALRFNGKNATLLAYPGEGHGLRGLANRRDLTIRYFQFFDHYLRGAPAPRWLTEGVPFLEKDLRRDAAKEIKPPSGGAVIAPTYADVLLARQTIAPYLKPTALYSYKGLSDSVGAELWVKHENHQPTGAFKVRGGVNFMAHLSLEKRRAGVITASTGNHGLSVAFAAQRFGVRTIIAVPNGANPVKVEAIRDFGAEIRFVGGDFEACRRYVEETAEQEGMHYLSSGDEPLLIAGVATHTLEIVEALPEVEVIIVPVGGGSGAAGACLVAKATNPRIQVIGVQAEGAPAAYRSWKEGRRVEAPITTFAEGLATGAPFDLPQSILRRELDDFILVSDPELKTAMRLLIAETRNLVEAAGAAALAAACKLREWLQGKRVALILSGGNLTLAGLRELLDDPAT